MTPVLLQEWRRGILMYRVADKLSLRQDSSQTFQACFVVFPAPLSSNYDHWQFICGFTMDLYFHVVSLTGNKIKYTQFLRSNKFRGKYQLSACGID